MSTAEKTIGSSRISLGEKVWPTAMDQDPQEKVFTAFFNIVGREFYPHEAKDVEHTLDGSYYLMPSSHVLWVSPDGSEIFAPCTEPITDDDGEPVTPELGTLLTQFVDLDKARRDLEERLAAKKKEIDALQDPLAEAMGLNGIQNARCNGMTVYKKTSRYVSKGKGIETETVCEALKGVGLGYMVGPGYNASSLKSRVKEYQDQWLELPEAVREKLAETHTETGVPKQLAALLSIGETVKVEARKA